MNKFFIAMAAGLALFAGQMDLFAMTGQSGRNHYIDGKVVSAAAYQAHHQGQQRDGSVSNTTDLSSTSHQGSLARSRSPEPTPPNAQNHASVKPGMAKRVFEKVLTATGWTLNKAYEGTCWTLNKAYEGASWALTPTGWSWASIKYTAPGAALSGALTGSSYNLVTKCNDLGKYETLCANDPSDSGFWRMAGFTALCAATTIYLAKKAIVG